MADRKDPEPVRPATLPPIAEDLLGEIARRPAANRIILGGGIALKHYADFRPTQDIDAWWSGQRDPDALRQITEAVDRVAAEWGLEGVSRSFGATDSIDLRRRGSGEREFSFQIAIRDVALNRPRASPWPPILIETLKDNIGSKMNALVNRGAPRDFVDIYEVIQRGLLTREECWSLWEAKNPGGSREVASVDILAALERIEQRRPLQSIPAPEQERAAALRNWFKDSFVKWREDE